MEDSREVPAGAQFTARGAPQSLLRVRVGVLQFVLGLLDRAPAEQFRSDFDRRRRRTAGEECDGDDEGGFFHRWIMIRFSVVEIAEHKQTFGFTRDETSARSDPQQRGLFHLLSRLDVRRKFRRQFLAEALGVSIDVGNGKRCSVGQNHAPHPSAPMGIVSDKRPAAVGRGHVAVFWPMRLFFNDQLELDAHGEIFDGILARFG